MTLVTSAIIDKQEEPTEDRQHEREELGVNAYTAPSIERIFAQLDQLRPLPFDQLKRDLPQSIVAGREHKGLVFGELITDSFLIFEVKRKNLLENFGSCLMQQALALVLAKR